MTSKYIEARLFKLYWQPVCRRQSLAPPGTLRSSLQREQNSPPASPGLVRRQDKDATLAVGSDN